MSVRSWSRKFLLLPCKLAIILAQALTDNGSLLNVVWHKAIRINLLSILRELNIELHLHQIFEKIYLNILIKEFHLRFFFVKNTN